LCRSIGLAARDNPTFTYMNGTGVMIAGQLFNHLLYHFTLTYSNWESVMVCFSESFESLSAGLQKSLWEVGAVPEQHRTDSLSAAVKSLKDEDEFTERYQGLIRHYDMRASHNNPGRGHENGDIEQSHHRFKRAVEPEMILRGCRDFENRAAYEAFLDQIVNRRNGRRREKLRQELAPIAATAIKADAITFRRRSLAWASVHTQGSRSHPVTKSSLRVPTIPMIVIHPKSVPK